MLSHLLLSCAMIEFLLLAVFEVTEVNGEKVYNTRKLDFLKRMLNIEEEGNFSIGGVMACLAASLSAPIHSACLRHVSYECRASSIQDSSCILFDLNSCRPGQVERFVCPCSTDEGATGPTESTVVELAGPDKAGKLAEVTRLLTNNGCNVRSAAVRHPATTHFSSPALPADAGEVQS